jgi:hypothetical protein
MNLNMTLTYCRMQTKNLIYTLLQMYFLDSLLGFILYADTEHS